VGWRVGRLSLDRRGPAVKAGRMSKADEAMIDKKADAVLKKP
jgi:hypothetical protein